MKWLSFLSLSLALLISTYVAYSYYAFQNFTEEQRLEHLITADFKRLRSSHILPKAFDSISHIEIVTGTEQARSWLEKIKLPIEQRPDGEFKLEVLLMSFEDEGRTAAVIQYNIVNNKTHDMVWELGRTFYLNP